MDASILIRKRNLFLPFLLFFVISCNNWQQKTNDDHVPKPVFNQSQTDEFSPILVRITCSMRDASIFYTLNGTEPDMNTPHYYYPLQIYETTTIKAIAYRHGYIPSEVAQIKISFDKVLPPVINLDSGIYYEKKIITITTPTPRAEIYYTLDGIDPRPHPAFLYEEPFELPNVISTNDIILTAIAYRDNLPESPREQRKYEFRIASMVEIPGGRIEPNYTYRGIISPFLMSNYLITQLEWEVLMSNNNNGINPKPSFFQGYPRHPVENISWYEAIVYCNLRSINEEYQPVYSLNGITDPSIWGEVPTQSGSDWDNLVMDITQNGYRLPTELEWLFAANEGRFTVNYTSPYYSGSNIIHEVAWYNANSNLITHEVGDKKQNALQIYDLSGNIFEWCWDWYNYAFPTGEYMNPTGPKIGSEKVVKGGSFFHAADRCEITYRHGPVVPNYRKEYYGFRVVRSVP